MFLDTPCWDTMEPMMASCLRLANRIASGSGDILIIGNSGSGKKTLSRHIHDKSNKNAPYVLVKTADLLDSQCEEKMFGEQGENGTHCMGLIDQATGGTLVIDGVTHLSPSMQSKIFHLTDTRTYYRVGAATPTPLSARLVFLGSPELFDLLKLKKFREDLFYRLDVLRLQIPNLENRKKDIPLLADYFLNSYNCATGKILRFSPEVYHALCNRDWPGQVLELKNFILKLARKSQDNIIRIFDFLGSHPALSYLAQDNLGPVPLHQMEKEYILTTLKRFGGNKSQTARSLQISLKTLRSKLRVYGSDAAAT